MHKLNGLPEDVQATVIAKMIGAGDLKSLRRLASSSKSMTLVVGHILSKHLSEANTSIAKDDYERAKENLNAFIKQSDSISRILCGETTEQERDVLALIDQEISLILDDIAARDRLQDEYVRAYIASGHMSMQQGKDCSFEARRALKKPFVRWLLLMNEVSMVQVLNIRLGKAENFDNPRIQRCFEAGHLAVKQILEIDLWIKSAFESPSIQKYLAEGRLSLIQVLKMTFSTVSAFSNPVVQHYFETNKLALEQILNASYLAGQAFESPIIQRYLAEDRLTPVEVLNITVKAYVNLSKSEIQCLISDRKLTPRQVLLGITNPTVATLHRVFSSCCASRSTAVVAAPVRATIRESELTQPLLPRGANP
ncbi:MAG: hypothetical protein K0R66_546 [Gammaproteobacteria bacterium]|nr:hypothetical protein [Gammaproteobacteria bacterium]